MFHRKPIAPTALATLLLPLLATLAACGGGGGSGPAPAAIDAGSAESLGVAAAQAAQQAVTSQTTEVPGGFFQPALGGSQASALPAAGAQLCESGTLDQSGGSNSFTISYNDCGFGGVVLNGSVTVSFSDDFDRISVRYSNFSSSFDGTTTNLSGYAYTCTGLSSVPTCTFDFGDFTSTLTGIRYDLEDIQVEGDAESGFQVSGSVADPGFGRIGFQTVVPIEFAACDFGVPEAGLIALDGAGDSSGSIEFLDCDTFEVCFTEDAESGEVCIGPIAWTTVGD